MSRFGSADTVRNMLAEGMASALVDGAMAVLTLVMMMVYAPLLSGLVMLLLCLWRQ